MSKRYGVTLELSEREGLEQLLSKGKADVRRLKHAQILLKADESKQGPGWSDSRIAEAVGCSTATVERVRRRFVEEGLELALSEALKIPKSSIELIAGETSPQKRFLIVNADVDKLQKLLERLIGT